MSINKVHKFPDITQLQYFLNGAIFGNAMPKQEGASPGWDGLVGLTLVFTQPASHTVTFAVSANSHYPPNILQFADVKAQIEAVMAGVLVTSIGGRLVLVEVSPASGVTVTAAGTANRLLGFDHQNPSVGKFYTPPGVTAGAQQWTWSYSVNENVHVVYTYE